MKSRPHIVYLTFDGLLEPLGYSQVARVIMELAERGEYRFTICSLEKHQDRQPSGREERLRDELRQRLVRWRRATWSGGPGGSSMLDVARNVRTMTGLVQKAIDSDGVDMIHARSYVAATVARTVGSRNGIPYLFDTRGFWVDERLERGLWFDGPVRAKAARMWERKLYADAAGAVTLTEMGAEEIRSKSLGPWKTHRPLSVIPTCVDYGTFGLGGPGDVGGISETLAERLRESLVVGYVGSVNPAYRIKESLRLFDHVLARRPDAHLLCLTRNPPALLTYIKEHPIPKRSYTVVSAEHRDMPQWLNFIDWGLLIRNTEPNQRSWRGAMPTKLGEFFATGVRPVYWGHSHEVRHWVDQAGSGHVLDCCDETALRQAAEKIATTPRCLHTLWGARWRTRDHFGLKSAIERYQELYDRVLAQEKSPRLRVLFLTEGTTVPASRFRVAQLVPHLQRRGISCTVRPAYGDGYNRWAFTPAAALYKMACCLQRIPYALDGDRFDAVFLQSSALPFSAVAERLANWRNPHTIFDVDDAIFAPIAGGDAAAARKVQTFEEVVESCAHVICGNDYLARHTRHLTPTSVIPTVVDTEVYRPVRGRKKPGLVIGWMGTASNFESLRLAAPILERLIDEFEDVTVQIVSNQTFAELEGVSGVEQKKWRADQEVQMLRDFDIGIMPLVESAVTRGKCGFKALQYMSVAIPVVASAVGVNREILSGESAGLLARNMEQFEAALRELLGDEKRRHKMGHAGRQLVKRKYSVMSVIDRYVDLIEAVARRVPERSGQLEQWTKKRAVRS